MKILFVHNAYQYFGGEDAVVSAEIRLLQTHGHEVVLYQRHNDELRGLKRFDAARDALWSRRSWSEVSDACATLRPDVIHVHNTFPLISPSIYWLAQRRHVPLVQTLHNFRLLCPQSGFLRQGTICHDCLGKLPWRAVTRKCYRNSISQSAVLSGSLSLHRLLGSYTRKVTLYIALSAFSRDRFIEGGLPPERLRIKPNFVEADPAPVSERRKGGLYVGRLNIDKGIILLLQAQQIEAGADIDVIGAGPCEAEVAAFFGARFLGFLPPETIRTRMRAAAFLVVPSTAYEQLPTTILEAFSCGLPVIASRLGPLISLVQDRVTGLLFTPGDAHDLAEKIRWASTHPGEMRQMGLTARAEYESKYTPAINYQLLATIYDDAIAAQARDA
jgi:glycosyltransferase involved in cell wall biosynthesis